MRIFAPGRIEIFGKHTDYAGGRSLVTAVPRGITVQFETATDARIIVDDADAGERAEFSAEGDGPDDGWRRYPRTVIRRLAANFPGTRLSARLRLTSDLPRAAGISSSSALVVGLAEALIAGAGIEDSAAWRGAIRTPEDRAGYFGCIENGATFGPLAGDAGVGTHGGSEDHAAIVMSRAGEVRQFSYAPIRLESAIAMPVGWTFVVVSSGVTARKTGEAQAEYNRLSFETGAIVAAWRRLFRDDRRTLGELARTGELRTLELPDDLRPRLEHFIAEDARVAEATAAFASGDVSRIGELAAASQSDADRLLRTQVPETRDLVAIALTSGAAGASAFGAGWGGSVWALVPASHASNFLREWLARYRERYPHHLPEGFVSPPSDGVSLIP